MKHDEQQMTILDWLCNMLMAGCDGDYSENEIIELIAAINDELPVVCPDQYLS